MAESARRPSLGQRVADLGGFAHPPRRPAPPRAPRSGAPGGQDVVVVGSGAAALSAAAGALSTGASVVVCEKGPVPGGTTACSGGVAHIYANAVMQAAEIADDRHEALAYMEIGRA